MKDVALVTYQAGPNLSASDQLLVMPLRACGLQAAAVSWDDPAVDWQRFDAVILRSCWDYHTRPQEFRLWLELLEQMGVPLYNTAQTVRWNMDKTYLRALAQHGVKTITTVWATQHDSVSLLDVLETEGWPQAVLKPTIGASADGIHIVSQADAQQAQAVFETLLNQGTVMVQPVVEQIREGELSLVFFRNEFSYAIRKMPGQGTLFVNSSYGGRYNAIEVSEEIIASAQQVLEIAQSLTGDTEFLYARVDGVMVEGEFILMELELIEPGLFLDLVTPEGPDQFAAAIKASVHADS